MYQFILLIHVFAAVCIIALVLVQQGKGATMGAAFGSGASQTVFGSRGSGSFLFRLTITFIIIFFLTSIVLNYMVMHAYKQQNVMPIPITAPKIPINNKTEPVPVLNKPETSIPANGANKATEKTQPLSPSEIPTRK